LSARLPDTKNIVQFVRTVHRDGTLERLHGLGGIPELRNRVAYGKERTIISRRGKDLAVIMPRYSEGHAYSRTEGGESNEGSSAGTDSDEERVRQETLKKLHANPEHYLTEYSKRFGNILNADDAATLFDEYNSNPAKYWVAVHPAATWIRDELLRRALSTVAPAGKNRVVFTAGGNAAGKITALAVSGVAKRAQVVFDSTFSNPEHAKRLIEQPLGAGKAVTVLYVTRPLGEIFRAMLDRAQQEGRVVTIEQLIGSHGGAAQTVRELSREYEADARVEFVFFDNSASGAYEGTIELAAPKDYTQIRGRLYDLLDAEYPRQKHYRSRLSPYPWHPLRRTAGPRAWTPKNCRLSKISEAESARRPTRSRKSSAN
jgi:hypothetical protein